MPKCVCKTKLGARCKNAAKPDSDRCGVHTKFMCTPFQQSARAQQRRPERYEILDNGGTPFIAFVDRNQKRVIVKHYDRGNSTSLFYYYEEIFLGEKLNLLAAVHYDGSSILLKTGKNKYILISRTIIEFTTEDEIVTFASPISGTVTYPYAIGKKNTYDLVNMVYKDNKDVDKAILRLEEDAAHNLYNPEGVVLKLSFKTLHKGWHQQQRA